MRLLLCLMICAGAMRAQAPVADRAKNNAGGVFVTQPSSQAPAAISRESLLELQLLVNREKEIKEKLQPLYDMLMEPVTQARVAVVERICKAAGIPMQENGQPSCEVDLSAGIARRVPVETKKEKASKDK